MLRWWLGMLILARIVVGSDALAQPAGSAGAAAPCDIVKIRTALASKRVPDFTGCSVDYAADILRASGYLPQKTIDDRANSAASGIVTRQTSDRRQVTLFYSSGIATPPPPPPPPPATSVQLSIKGPHTVTEGDIFKLTLIRDPVDQRSQSGTLSFQPTRLLNQPPLAFTFSGKSNTLVLTLATTLGTPGDGDHPLVVVATSTNDGEIVGKPAAARIVVTDRPPPQSYSVAAIGEHLHGTPISFVVTRTDPADQTVPTYTVQQDGKELRPAQLVPFGDGEPTWTTQVKPGEYNDCGGPVSFVLSATPNNIIAAASLAGEAPANCAPPATGEGTSSPKCDPNCPASDPLWPRILAGLAAILILAVDAVIYRKWRLAKIAASISAICRPEFPSSALRTLGEQALHWPGATAEVRFEPGATPTPDPLPVETDDHG